MGLVHRHILKDSSPRGRCSVGAKLIRVQGQHPMHLLRSAHHAFATQGNTHFGAGATPHARLRFQYYFD
jgi:hypothetical protein